MKYKILITLTACWLLTSIHIEAQCKDSRTEQLKVSELFADSLISTLTLEDKVALLSGMGTSRSEFGDKGVTVFGVKGLPDKNIPDIIMGHGITGVRSGRDKKNNSTYMCSPIGMGCSWDLNLYRRIGVAIAQEMRGMGQDLNLGPTVNIIRHPLGGRNWECYSEDPYLSSRLIAPYVQSMQSNGIICGPKHFVANNQEHCRFDINNVVDERTLREIYFPGFKSAVQVGGAMNIMSSYNRLNGVFMCQNDLMLNDILRKEWGYEGFVLSDFSKGLRSTHAGVYGGLDLEMPGPLHYGKHLVTAIKDGSISEEHLNRMLHNMIKTVHWIGVFDREKVENKEVVHCEQHIKLAKEAALASPVLLKNDNNILPLKKGSFKSIAILGPNAKRFETLPTTAEHYAYYLQGGGSGRTYYFAESVVSPYSGLKNALTKNVDVSYAQGCVTPDMYGAKTIKNLDESPNKALINEAVDKAKKSDVAVIFAGLSGLNESEGWDQLSVELPGAQNELIDAVTKVNSNTIVVLIGGSYMNITPWINKVKGVIFAPYTGEQIGNGLADVLLGKVSPCGKLPISWPKTVNDYPQNSIYTGKGYAAEGTSNEYNEGIFVGYRWFDKQNIDVLFPFGYGLSYAKFKYSNIKVDQSTFPIKVEFTITNKGKQDAAEIAQLYISDLESTVEKAPRELKEFLKVSLKAGESRTLKFTLPKTAFAHYDTKIKSWRIEAGDFLIGIGKDSRTIVLKENVKLKEAVLE